MERRGVYRKGSANHARNVNSYQIFRQRMKKWRVPLTAFLTLVMIFGIAPVTGDQFQASLLSLEEQEQLKQVDANNVRKVLAVHLKNFLNDCNRFKMTSCVEKGNLLMNDVINSGEDAGRHVVIVEDFVANFETDVALAVCKYDLAKTTLALASLQKSVQAFSGEYSDVLPSTKLSSALQSLNDSFGNLKSFTDACSKVMQE